MKIKIVKIVVEEIIRKLNPRWYMRALHRRLDTMPEKFKPSVWRK